MPVITGSFCKFAMLFNSLQFFIFFVVVYVLYLNLSFRAQNVMLLIASCVFYGLWSWKFFGLLAFSIVMDYTAARLVESADNPKCRKLALAVSLTTNLSLLGFFKYYNFFVDSLTELLAHFSIHGPSLHLNIVLPIGISFYTFHTMSYVIDVYERKLPACKNFVDFALFVTFFPQLVAGPIARGTALLPQMQAPRKVTFSDIETGIFLIVWGLFEKVIVADGCAYVVNAVFDHDRAYGGLDKLVAVYAFAFQIYGDFAGYSDMARGLAKLMGFDLMLNFNLPYFATNPSDFWRRWHISLSTWLRDYLYISLGGSKGSRLLTYRNLFLTMLLGGIWHGASWTMVFWGMFHGTALIVHRLLTGDKERRREHERGVWKKGIQIVFMFHVICLGWLLFRASNLAQVGRFLVGMATDLHPSEHTAGNVRLILELVVPLMAFQFLQYRVHTLQLFEQWKASRRALFLVTVGWASLLFFILNRSLLQGEQPFIYFQF